MNTSDRLYPKEWYESKDFKVSRNVIEMDTSDRRLLQEQKTKTDYELVTDDIVRNNKHPFDEVTYFLRTHKHYIVADVRNNRDSDCACVMRIIVDRDHIGNIAIGKNGNILDIRCFNEKDQKLLSGNGLYVWRLNKQVGYYTLSCHSKKVGKKIGKSSTCKAKSKISDRPTHPIRIRDIADLCLSTYVEGGGSKPTHEFGVRGHIRRYKNGKEVFIKPYIKCKGRGVSSTRAYKIG